MIKRDLDFLKKYESCEGTITFDNDNVIISITNPIEILETHKISTETVASFDLKDFLLVFKEIHGSRHQFEIQNDTITIVNKSNQNIEFIRKIKNSIQRTISFNKFDDIGSIDSISLERIGMYTDITTNLDYISFLKNPMLISSDNKFYFWGTDCIHQLRIEASVQNSFNIPLEIPVEYCKFIKKFINKNMSVLKIAYDKAYLKIYDDANSIYIKVNPLKNSDVYIEDFIKEESITITRPMLKELEDLKLKKLCSDINKNCTKTYEVIYTIIEGVLYLQGENIFNFNEPITCIKPISAYKLNDLILSSKEIQISKSYIQSGNVYLIL